EQSKRPITCQIRLEPILRGPSRVCERDFRNECEGARRQNFDAPTDADIEPDSARQTIARTIAALVVMFTPRPRGSGALRFAASPFSQPCTAVATGDSPPRRHRTTQAMTFPSGWRS